MTRTFTTLFSYNGNNYTAVITHLDGIVNIYVPDESLHSILPEGGHRITHGRVLE